MRSTGWKKGAAKSGIKGLAGTYFSHSLLETDCNALKRQIPIQMAASTKMAPNVTRTIVPAALPGMTAGSSATNLAAASSINAPTINTTILTMDVELMGKRLIGRMVTPGPLLSGNW